MTSLYLEDELELEPELSESDESSVTSVRSEPESFAASLREKKIHQCEADRDPIGSAFVKHNAKISSNSSTNTPTQRNRKFHNIHIASYLFNNHGCSAEKKSKVVFK